jgi:hypothetical protein
LLLFWRGSYHSRPPGKSIWSSDPKKLKTRNEHCRGYKGCRCLFLLLFRTGSSVSAPDCRQSLLLTSSLRLPEWVRRGSMRPHCESFHAHVNERVQHFRNLVRQLARLLCLIRRRADRFRCTVPKSRNGRCQGSRSRSNAMHVGVLHTGVAGVTLATRASLCLGCRASTLLHRHFSISGSHHLHSQLHPTVEPGLS